MFAAGIRSAEFAHLDEAVKPVSPAGADSTFFDIMDDRRVPAPDPRRRRARRPGVQRLGQNPCKAAPP
jgi:hypothetical protein